MKLIRTLLLGLALVFAAPVLSSAQETGPDPDIVVHIASDDVRLGHAGLRFALNRQTSGIQVAVYLNVRAVRLANSAVPQQVDPRSAKTSFELIDDIVAAGGRVFVCPACTQDAGLDPADFVAGAERSGPDLIEAIMAPGTKIISF